MEELQDFILSEEKNITNKNTQSTLKNLKQRHE